ncbi:MAG: phosphatase PAP2 family protein [Methanobrevibacter sp.]|uniref:phosphatase PAP2 family protein n=1 Tax=Methanobrevibacter sp. TaxID=66852 RepID=UPI001B176A6C|nr:phosphatase PAP2 family protein [Methanobrevibacter sp.]MBO5151029.1 phosphatase PAP2 family protein [Methanobrevibacter sp.]
MFDVVFYFQWEVYLILLMQSSLPGFVLEFFKIIANVVSKNVLAFLFISIYLAYNKEWGRFTLLSLGVAGVCCDFVKVSVARLRPYAAVDNIKCIYANVPDQDPLNFKIQGYSLPSGHSMLATNLFLAIPIYVRNIQYIAVGLVGVLIVALSRVGLGVHFPTDTIAGFIIALAIILILSRIFDRIENRTYLYLGIIALSLIGIVFCPEISYIKYVALASGISLGFLFEEKYVNFENPKSRRDAIVRFAGAIILFALLFVLIPKLAGNTDLIKCIEYSLFTFIMLAIYPLTFKKIDGDG